MASKEFIAFQEKMAQNPPPPPAKDLNESRARIDAAMGGLPLAEGTTATEVSANGVKAYLQQREGGENDPLVIYFHGGGYRIASALAYRAYLSNLVVHTKVRVLNVDYRLAPENRVPAAVDDGLAAYKWALAQGTPASRIVIAGDSAGGGLTAAVLLAAKQNGVAQPAGAICLSPWSDLRNTAASYTTKSTTDKLFSLTAATEASGLYLGTTAATNPLASPNLGDLSGVAPLLVLVGDVEVLLDDAYALVDRARACGTQAELHVFPDMPHVWMLSYPAYPEAGQAFDLMDAFVHDVAK